MWGNKHIKLSVHYLFLIKRHLQVGTRIGIGEYLKSEYSYSFSEISSHPYVINLRLKGYFLLKTRQDFLFCSVANLFYYHQDDGSCFVAKNGSSKSTWLLVKNVFFLSFGMPNPLLYFLCNCTEFVAHSVSGINPPLQEALVYLIEIKIKVIYMFWLFLYVTA